MGAAVVCVGGGGGGGGREGTIPRVGACGARTGAARRKVVGTRWWGISWSQARAQLPPPVPRSPVPSPARLPLLTSRLPPLRM